jgi:hypothetical protein
MLPLEQFLWPVTLRWNLECEWGETQQIMTLDAPGLQGDLEGTMRLGSIVWSRAVAPATVLSTKLVSTDVVMWRFQPSPLTMLDGQTRGTLAGAPAPRDQSACIMSLTRHLDSRGVRRFPLPGIPAHWVGDGVLTPGAFDTLEQLGGMWIMGLMSVVAGGSLEWLHAYPGALEPSVVNPAGVGFRKVARVAGCWHTRRAPVPSGAPWPS